MLHGKSESNKLEDIVKAAFFTQTMVTKDNVVRYAKEDVYLAKQAYDVYLQNQSHSNLTALQSAVQRCADYDRKGFKKLNQALIVLLQNTHAP